MFPSQELHKISIPNVSPRRSHLYRKVMSVGRTQIDTGDRQQAQAWGWYLVWRPYRMPVAERRADAMLLCGRVLWCVWGSGRGEGGRVKAIFARIVYRGKWWVNGCFINRIQIGTILKIVYLVEFLPQESYTKYQVGFLVLKSYTSRLVDFHRRGKE